jgi:hypothetical protein
LKDIIPQAIADKDRQISLYKCPSECKNPSTKLKPPGKISPGGGEAEIYFK